MAFGDIHNHNGSICKADKRPCPFGDEGHSKDLESYVDHHVQESGVDGSSVRTMIADGTPPADAVAVAKEGLSADSSTVSRSSGAQDFDELKQSPEGVDRFQAYKEQWNSSWEKTYKQYYNQMEEERRTPQQRAALADRSTPGTYDGAWVKPQDDGGMAIPAGEYVWASSDGWDNDEVHSGSGAEKWSSQALEGTPPGTVGGAYLDGKPAFFLTSMSMGENHGYDGEILVPKETYNRLSQKGYFKDGGTEVSVKRDTVIYGDLGNPKDAPKGLYSWKSDYNSVSPEAETIYMGEGRRKGTALNHPFIEVDSNS